MNGDDGAVARQQSTESTAPTVIQLHEVSSQADPSTASAGPHAQPRNITIERLDSISLPSNAAGQSSGRMGHGDSGQGEGTQAASADKDDHEGARIELGEGIEHGGVSTSVAGTNGPQQVELVEHSPESSSGPSNTVVPSDDPHEWFPDSDYELKRVKVYELIGSRWVDQGTAFCFGQFQDETNEALLIARSETNYADVILSTTIRSNDVYQRQQDTLIVWTEPDGVDYALSFQDPEGCSEVWNFILEVQRYLNSREDPNLIGSSSPFGPGEGITTASIIRSGHLPQPQLGIIGEIERAIKSLARTQQVKERMCEYIQQEEYIKQLIDVFRQAEDLENLENMHALCLLMQTILMLNDHGIYEHILDDELFFGVVGMLEYDPEFPLHKANYREFLRQTTQFHQPIPISDPAIQSRIHHTYRLQFLKDVVLARVLDDSTFNVLNSCIIFNQVDIITHVQQDQRFLREVVGLYVDEDMLSGGGKRVMPQEEDQQVVQGSVNVNLGDREDPKQLTEVKKGEEEKVKLETDGMEVDQKSPNGLSQINGQPSKSGRSASRTFVPFDELTEEDITLRREVIFLIQQLCVMGKNVQLPARMALFRSLVDRGVLFAVQWAIGLSEKDEINKPIISAGGEILAALLDHDLTGVRGHVLKQITAIEKERAAGKKSAEKAETILAMACKILTQSRDLAVQCQVGDALKMWLEIPQGDGSEQAHPVVGVKLLGRKDDPGTEKFLEYFYNGGCVQCLLKPFQDIPEWRNVPDPILPLTRDKTNLYVYLCDLLSNFALQHSFRSHFFILTSNIALRLCTLFKAKDKHLQHAAFRFFRILLKQNNRNMMVYFMKHDVFKPILDLTLQESRRDNLLSSSCQEFFEIMRKENMKDPIKHCMTRYGSIVQKLAESPLGATRFQLFIRRWEMNNEPLPEETKVEKPVDTRIWPGQGRLMEAEEEDYFNNDDEEDDSYVQSIASQWTRGTPNALKRKRRPLIGPAPKNLRQASVPLRPVSPVMSSLLDYSEDDEEVLSVDNTPKPTSGLPLSPSLQTPPSPVSVPLELPPSPKLAHRQILISPSSPGPPRRALSEDEEDNLLESLIRKTRPPALSVLSSIPIGAQKRRRDDGDDGMLERLSKAKKPDLGPQKDNPTTKQRSKVGDDPPKKMRVKLGASNIGAASGSPTCATTPASSKTGAKDGDTG